MNESRPVSQVPWQVTMDEFIKAATAVTDGGACCMFVIDEAIPPSARTGYAALVIAYARSSEPVCILEDGSALLLVREGGTGSGEVVARRILDQMRRLSLEHTLRAGVAPLGADAAAAVAAARSAATSGAAGNVVVSA